MGLEVWENISRMGFDKLERQLMFQCAPLIAGLRISNLFVIPSEQWKHLCDLLCKSPLHCRILYRKEESLTVLLYHPVKLSAYLLGRRARTLLYHEGYKKLNLKYIISTFTCRYRMYRTGSRSFPHELGLLLGYPLDDVEGFIKNGGEHSLYTGYWKVYANVPAKRHLFRKYEYAREELLEQILHGVRLEEVLFALN